MASAKDVRKGSRRDVKLPFMLSMAALAIAIVSLMVVMTADDTEGFNKIVVDGNEYVFYADNENELELLFYDNSNSTAIIPGTITYEGRTLTVVSIHSGAFELAMHVTSVCIPETVRHIGHRAFSYLHLLYLEMPISLDASQNNAFSGCNAIYNMVFTKGTGIGHDYTKESVLDTPWRQSRNLWTVDFRFNITSIGDYMFYGCDKLRDSNVILPESVTSIGENAFGKCSNITKFNIPSSTTSIGEDAFDGCTGLAEFTVSNGNTIFSAENGVLFDKWKTEVLKCPSKSKNTSFVAPGSLERIADEAFMGCEMLATLDLRAVSVIGDRAFSGCTGLNEVKFGKDLSSVGEGAFENTTFGDYDYTAIEPTADNLRNYTYNRSGGMLVRQPLPTVYYMVNGKVMFIDRYFPGTVVTIREKYELPGYKTFSWTPKGDLDVVDGKFVMGEKNVTFNTITLLQRYTLTFMDGSQEYARITDYYGAKIDVPELSRTGYTFLGWYQGDVRFESNKIPAENMTLNAVWSINQYTLSFDSMGGTEVAAITQDYGTKVTKPANPSKEGNRFIGWYLGDTQYVFTTMPAEDLSLHARWSPNIHLINFTTNGDPIEGYPIQLKYGETIIKPSIEPSYRVIGAYYEFVEWGGYTAGMTVTGDMEFPAEFMKIITDEKTYAIYIIDDDDDSIPIKDEVMDSILEMMESNPNMSLEIELNDGSISMDYESVVKLSDSKEDMVSLLKRSHDELPTNIRNDVEGRPVYKISVGGISDFKIGLLTIRLDYLLGEGESAENLRIWHYGSDGSMVEEECTYDAEEGCVEFTTSTFSHFAIMHIEPETYGVEIGTAICVLASLVVVAAIVATRKH